VILQNKYFGDIGDFGKYGLLRSLRSGGLPGKRPASLGVAWWLVPDDHKSPDGRFTEYLEKPEKFRLCDEQLFDKIKHLVKKRRRDVSGASDKKILGGAEFFEKTLDFSDHSAASETGRAERREKRKRWVGEAVEKAKNRDIVFLDPDNGIEIPSTKKHHRAGPKFVFYDEIGEFVARSRVVVVYHHLCRHKKYGKHPKQIANRRAALLKYVPNGNVFAIRFKRYNSRAYFLMVSRKQDGGSISRFLHGFVSGKWSICFEDKVYGRTRSKG